MNQHPTPPAPAPLLRRPVLQCTLPQLHAVFARARTLELLDDPQGAHQADQPAPLSLHISAANDAEALWLDLVLAGARIVDADPDRAAIVAESAHVAPSNDQPKGPAPSDVHPTRSAPLCKDCCHRWQSRVGPELCDHWSTPVDSVRGGGDGRYWPTVQCAEARATTGHCGPLALHFRPRPDAASDPITRRATACD